ncbi:uncharacterized protein [Periplaneta americana]|uniref:uncharacterized protein isoform X5 n=1 Tax=Periplaneta americana TaxID=6978 RepID=UPI0037E95172
MQPAIHSKEKVTMDVIKAELKVDPLALETSEDTDKEEKKPILEGVQISTQIKRECDDNSCNLISGMKYETQEELCDFDIMKDELKLEVKAEENENLANRFLLTRLSYLKKTCDRSLNSIIHC